MERAVWLQCGGGLYGGNLGVSGGVGRLVSLRMGAVSVLGARGGGAQARDRCYPWGATVVRLLQKMFFVFERCIKKF